MELIFSEITQCSWEHRARGAGNIQKRSVNTALDETPTMDEMVRTIKGLKDEKAPG